MYNPGPPLDRAQTSPGYTYNQSIRPQTLLYRTGEPALLPDTGGRPLSLDPEFHKNFSYSWNKQLIPPAS